MGSTALGRIYFRREKLLLVLVIIIRELYSAHFIFVRYYGALIVSTVQVLEYSTKQHLSTVRIAL